MDKIIKTVNFLSNIKKLYEEVFNKNGMEKFTQLIWFNIRNDFDNIPTDEELFFRVVVEELIIYGMILENEIGYETLTKHLVEQKVEIKIKPYEEISAYYKEYIEKVQKFLEEHPNRRQKTILE